jgi:hypothetical protein
VSSLTFQQLVAELHLQGFKVRHVGDGHTVITNSEGIAIKVRGESVDRKPGRGTSVPVLIKRLRRLGLRWPPPPGRRVSLVYPSVAHANAKVVGGIEVERTNQSMENAPMPKGILMADPSAVAELRARLLAVCPQHHSADRPKLAAIAAAGGFSVSLLDKVRNATVADTNGRPSLLSQRMAQQIAAVLDRYDRGELTRLTPTGSAQSDRPAAGPALSKEALTLAEMFDEAVNSATNKAVKEANATIATLRDQLAAAQAKNSQLADRLEAATIQAIRKLRE